MNTSIRTGWFWHESENDKVRSLAELVHIYNNYVGGNATFLLNVPPTRDGLLHENDVKRLAELGEYIKNTFRTNLAEEAVLSADSGNIEAARNDNYSEYYITDKGRTTAEIAAEWENPVTVGCIVLKENILCSQRVESFSVEVEQDCVFAEIYRGTVIG